MRNVARAILWCMFAFDKSSISTGSLTLHPKISVRQGDDVLLLLISYILQDILR